MAKHQIIYTSCMRGIDGVNDGQQIFSYDKDFRNCKSDDVKGLFTFQIPSLAPGVIMTEEIAKTMPSAFNLRQLNSGDIAITLNTYLGRDYMGSAGRFGNQLSHSIVSDFNEFDVYPCELYGSDILRREMKYEEVNNPNPPDYLPEPSLDVGNVINSDAIIEFLGIGDNLEYFKRMFVAMLKFPEEKKRVVICDETENIVKWIAALHYSLPLDIAKSVSFSTYDYNPELSPSKICGVVSEGTRYNVSNYASSEWYYVFDFVNNQFSDLEYEEKPLIFFLDTSFSFSYESLVKFKDFISSKTSYREASERYYAGFNLYSLLSKGIGDLSLNNFKQMVSFVDDYTTESLKREMISKILEERQKIDELNNEFALSVLGYMLRNLAVIDEMQQIEVKQMIVDRLISSLSDGSLSEKEFIPLYNNLDEMARTINVSLPAELMVERNRDYLLSVLAKQEELWKILFIVRIISDYVKDIRLSVDELYPNKAIGAIYYNIVKLGYHSGRQNGQQVVESILDNFKEDNIYFVNMALNIEACLADLQLGETDMQHLWGYVIKFVASANEGYGDSFIKEMLVYERCQEVYSLFKYRLNAAQSLPEAREIFYKELNKWFSGNRSYKEGYATVALEDYFDVFDRKRKEISEDEVSEWSKELARIAMKLNVKEEYTEEIFSKAFRYIPLEKPSSENGRFINEVFDYYYNVLGKSIEGKLLLLIIGIYLSRVNKRTDIKTVCEDILLASGSKGAALRAMHSDELNEYFEWTLSSTLGYSLVPDDFVAIYKLFDMSHTAHSLFMEFYCRRIFKKCKGEKDYFDFANFLNFLFYYGTVDDQEMVGKIICKLSKQKLEELDEEMNNYYMRDRKSARGWQHVQEVASDTNPIVNSISNIFKRKQ